MKKSVCVFISVLTLQACYEDEVDVGFDYQSGDVITMVPTFNSQTDSVEFYWDNVKIATERVIPYVHKFQVTSDISSGNHEYSMKMYYRDNDNNDIGISIKTSLVRIK